MPTGCGGELVGTTQVMIFYEDWHGKQVRREGQLDEFFNSTTSFSGYICGKKWYSRREMENVLVICERCIKRLGWKW